MNSTNTSPSAPEILSFHTSLWQRILDAEELRDRDNLEKLLAGCEVIAALDGRDLLAA